MKQSIRIATSYHNFKIKSVTKKYPLRGIVQAMEILWEYLLKDKRLKMLEKIRWTVNYTKLNINQPRKVLILVKKTLLQKSIHSLVALDIIIMIVSSMLTFDQFGWVLWKIKKRNSKCLEKIHKLFMKQKS